MENNTLVENSIITKDVMDTLDFERLDAKAQGEILKMKESLDVSSTESILQFGNTASKNITSMSKEMLGAFKMNDIPEVAQLLPTLTNAFDQVDTQSLMPKKKSWFSRLGKSSGVSNFVQKFETVEQVVQGIQKNLQQAYFEIQRDIETERQMGQKNLEFIQQLDYAIFAIKMAYKEELEKVEIEEAQLNKEDVLAAHLVQEHRDQVTCIDRQIYSLSCQRVQAIQTLPILRTIIDGNIGLSSNISTAINQSIPTWERNIVIALQLHRQQGALEIERAVHDMTNNLIKSNSLLMKENAVEITKAVEGGLIDIESLEETNKNLIETARAVAEVATAASKNRADGYIKMDNIVKELVASESTKLTGYSPKMLGG